MQARRRADARDVSPGLPLAAGTGTGRFCRVDDAGDNRQSTRMRYDRSKIMLWPKWLMTGVP